MPRLALLLFLFSMAPTALAQNAGPFQVLRDPSGGSREGYVLMEVDPALARDIEQAVLADGEAARGTLLSVLLSGVGYVAGGYAGYGVGLLTDTDFIPENLISGPGFASAVIFSSVGSALGAHLGARSRAPVWKTISGTVLVHGLFVLVASRSNGRFELTPALLASPFVAISTSVTLEWLYGGR